MRTNALLNGQDITPFDEAISDLQDRLDENTAELSALDDSINAALAGATTSIADLNTKITKCSGKVEQSAGYGFRVF